MTTKAKGQEGRTSRPVSKVNGTERAQHSISRGFPPKEKSLSLAICFQRHLNGDWAFAVADDDTVVQLCADCALKLSVAAGRTIEPSPTNDSEEGRER
jgi:hypothetical protein